MVRCLSATETGEREKAQRRRKIQWYVLISLSSGNLLSHLFEGVQPYHANLSVTYTPSYPNPKLILICAHDFGTTQLRKSKRVIKRKHITK
jgi:hypothetical protein